MRVIRIHSFKINFIELSCYDSFTVRNCQLKHFAKLTRKICQDFKLLRNIVCYFDAEVQDMLIGKVILRNVSNQHFCENFVSPSMTSHILPTNDITYSTYQWRHIFYLPMTYHSIRINSVVTKFLNGLCIFSMAFLTLSIHIHVWISVVFNWIVFLLKKIIIIVKKVY